MDNHHAIKSRLRTDLIAKLPISSGDHVADLGCGSGNWSLLAADRVGIHGKVIGVDSNADSIARAERRRSTHILGKIIAFRQARLEEFELAPASVDVIILFNILSYIREPLDFVTRLLPALRPAGRLFVKDTDIQAEVFWPVPFEAYSDAMGFIAHDRSLLVEGNYDPFFARRVPALLRNFPELRVNTISQAFSFFSPLSPEERNYVRANAAIISELASAHGGQEAAQRWYSLFGDSNGASVLDNPDFMFTMNEFVFQAVRT